MFINIDGIQIFYQRHIGKGLPVLLLHGWGGSTDTMFPVFNYLSRQNRNVVSIDLAGFGKSDLPPESYGIYEYAALVEEILKRLEIDKVILLGHSFGGRISIILAAQSSIVEKIILVDSAGMKPRRKLSYYIRVLKYKRAKRKNKDVSGYGSEDYKALPQAMRTVFTRVVNQFLERELARIACPALIVWGENDADTPLYMARRLNKGIKDSGIAVLKNCGHYSYLDDRTSFNLILSEFIKER